MPPVKAKLVNLYKKENDPKVKERLYTQPPKFTDRFLAKLLLYCVIWLKSTALAKAYRNERDIHVKERLLLILRGYHL